jgi:hypothetical protein
MLISLADDFLGFLFRRSKRWYHDSQQHRYDADNDQQFYKRKGFSGFGFQIISPAIPVNWHFPFTWLKSILFSVRQQ